MARIAGVDLPKNKRVEIGLTYIYGIGRPSRGPTFPVSLFHVGKFPSLCQRGGRI